LVVTREGMPLGYELFAGNRADVTTVKEIVESMERRYGPASRIWVMDRGMASAANIKWLQDSGRRYLIGTTRAVLRQFMEELSSATGWQTVGEGVEVKLVAGADGEDRYLLCRSARRQAKEHAMHQRFAARIEQGLARMAGRIAGSKGPLERAKLERQIGRLLGANGHAAQRYVVELLEDPSCAATATERFDQPAVGAARRTGRGLLRVAHQSDALGRADAVAHLHPAHPGTSRFPHSQARPIYPSHLASKAKPR
jgi:hypothetical protein